MMDAGVFAPDAKLELLEGEIINMSPQKSRHATAVRLAEEALRMVFGDGFDVRPQLPLSLDAFSEPEPDIAVVEGGPRDYKDSHPTTAVLVVEVSDTTANYDRNRKLPVYAKAGVPEYWILDLNNEWLEVYTDPGGSSYAKTETFRGVALVHPHAATGDPITVSELLP